MSTCNDNNLIYNIKSIERQIKEDKEYKRDLSMLLISSLLFTIGNMVVIFLTGNILLIIITIPILKLCRDIYNSYKTVNERLNSYIMRLINIMEETIVNKDLISDEEFDLLLTRILTR